MATNKIISSLPQLQDDKKPKSAMCNPKIVYAKPLYYISLITALSCPINLEKYHVKSSAVYKIYGCIMILAIIFTNGFCLKGRMSTSYTFLLQTVIITDAIQQIILLISNIYSIVNVLLYGQRFIQNYFDMLKQIDSRLLTTMNLRKLKIIFNIELLISHIIMVILVFYDYYTWTSSLGVGVWQYYGFRLYTFYLSFIIVLQIRTFANALKLRFQILNERLFDVSSDWIGNVQSQEAVTIRDLLHSYKKNSIKIETSGISLQCIVKMHDLLCDVIGLVNNAYGSNTVLLVCSIIVNSVIAFNLTLIFATGIQPSTPDSSYNHVVALNALWAIWFLTMGVAVARSCDQTSKEAWRTATICYKFLSCIPYQSTVPKEIETRIILKQLADQVEHRRPEFDACGFFPINHSMLYAIIGAVSSYIVIIIQFNNSPIMINAFKNASLTF